MCWLLVRWMIIWDGKQSWCLYQTGIKSRTTYTCMKSKYFLLPKSAGKAKTQSGKRLLDLPQNSDSVLIPYIQGWRQEGNYIQKTTNQLSSNLRLARRWDHISSPCPNCKTWKKIWISHLRIVLNYIWVKKYLNKAHFNNVISWQEQRAKCGSLSNVPLPLGKT